MVSPSSFFRFMSTSGLGLLHRSPDRHISRIRSAMLSLLPAPERSEEVPSQRLAQRVRFADDLESLWYLRQDLLQALSATVGEAVAHRQIQRITRMFRGRLPQAMVPRARQTFGTHA